MAFTRSTIIDASPAGDSVKQAVLDLDADLTGAFEGLNQVQAAAALKISQSEYDQPGGVPRLDDAGRIKAAQIPGSGADLPLGMVAAFATESLPDDSNWLECNGAELAVEDYPDLHAVVGDAFGLADPGNFLLPDLRGEFLRGWDDGAGNDPDAARRSGADSVGSRQTSATLDHFHQMFAQVVTGATGGGNAITFNTNQTYAGNTQFTAGLLAVAEGGAFAPSAVGATLGWTPARVSASETRPRNVAVLYAIKWR